MENDLLNSILDNILINEMIKKNAPIESLLQQLITEGCPCCTNNDKDNFVIAYMEQEFWYVECMNCGKKFYLTNLEKIEEGGINDVEI